MDRVPVILMLMLVFWFFWPDSEEEEWEQEPVMSTHWVNEAFVEVVMEPDYDAVNSSYEEYWELSLGDDELWGWSSWDDINIEPLKEDEAISCELHLVEPEFVDDAAILSLGHEMYHCLRGDFHE